jgi:Xaa-Pro aminopeptidase
VLVTAAEKIEGAEKTVNAFETLSLAPIDRRLIDPAMLDAEEIAWLDAYHTRVREALSASVDAETKAWLANATSPLRKA